MGATARPLPVGEHDRKVVARRDVVLDLRPKDLSEPVVAERVIPGTADGLRPWNVLVGHAGQRVATLLTLGDVLVIRVVNHIPGVV